METLLTAERLTAGWKRPVVGPLDFALGRGEVVGLLGPNGAGKSTVLAALAGRARVFSGRLGKRPGLSIALQTQAALPADGIPLSGRELLALTGAAATGLPDWLGDRLGQRYDELSGGQRQYLSLWAILDAPADLVLLDEPTNNLDRAGSEHLAGALRTRAEHGAGVLLVSHDRDFVARVCDRVVLLAGLEN